MEKRQKRAMNMSVISIMAIMSLVSSGNAVSSVLQKLVEAFPDASPATVRMVATLPNLTSMAVGLIAGMTLGKTLRYRTLYVWSMIAFVIGGVGPAFFNHNLGVILLFRVLFGMALGGVGTGNAYILSSQSRVMHTKIIGMGTLFTNIGGAVLQLLSGTLADIRWQYAFLPYFVGVIVLLFALRIPEPKDVNPEYQVETVEEKDSRERINKRVGIYYLINTFVVITACPVMTGMAAMVEGRHLGGATEVAVILTVCSFGGVICGLIFARFCALFKRFTIPATLFIQGLGIFICLIAGTVMVMSIGALISGIGTILMSALSATYIGETTSKSTIPLATSILMVFTQFGMFMSSYWIAGAYSLLGTFLNIDAGCAYLLACPLYLIAIIITLIIDCTPQTES